jgi:hypothetical protein
MSDAALYSIVSIGNHYAANIINMSSISELHNTADKRYANLGTEMCMAYLGTHMPLPRTGRFLLRPDKTCIRLLRSLFWTLFIVSVFKAIGRSRFDPRQGQRIFLLAPASRPALGPTQPPIQWVPGGPFPGGKAWPGRDADHSPPSTAEVKNE